MDAEQKAKIKERFLEIATDEVSATRPAAALGMILDSIIEETEKDRISREAHAATKDGILAMEAKQHELAARTEVNAGRPGNPLGFNARVRDPKLVVCEPFKTHDEHDAFMMKLLRRLRQLEEMGTNSMTNDKHWVLEGNEVGAFARAMRDELFPVQQAIPRPPAVAE